MHDRSFVKLRPEAQAKVDALFKEMGKERLKVILKAFGQMLILGFLTAIVAIANNLQQTAFPMIVGLGTWLIVNATYIYPNEKEIVEHYGEEIKKVVEEERRAQAQES